MCGSMHVEAQAGKLLIATQRAVMSAAAYTGLGVEGGIHLGCVCVSGWGDKAVMDECNQLTHVRHMHPCTFFG